MLKLRDIRAVHVVAEAGSVSRAAELLNLSQPAVTHAIKRVEDALGIELFLRSYTGMKPTAIGTVFRLRAAAVFAHLDMDADTLEMAGANRIRSASWPSFVRSVTLPHLRLLIQLQRCRSIDVAAKRLEVSKTLVYRMLRDMEAQLGTDLFRRDDNFAPTPSGRMLCRRANLVFAELRVLDEEIAQSRGRLRGRIKVGTLPSARTILVPKAIAFLLRQYPEIRVSMAEKPYPEMLSELSNGVLDIIVGSVHPVGFEEDLEQHLLFEDPVAVLSRAGHPLLKKAQLNLYDLARQRWVMPPPGVPSRIYFDTLFARHDISTPVDIVETDSMILLRQLMLDDDRLTMTSPYRALTELQAGLLQVMPFRINDLSLFFGYQLRTQRELPPCLRVFVETLRHFSAAEVARRATQPHAWDQSLPATGDA
jgi:LysR family transcriptional regulator, regulator for genes of the gallate degradation pathway